MAEVYVDFANYLQEEINKVNGNFKVWAERNVDSYIDGDVIVSAKSGKYYRTSAEIPYQIDIITSDPKGTIDFFTDLFKDLNNTSFNSIVGKNGQNQTYNITQFYQTPAVIESDISIGSDHYARIVTFASLYITYNVSNVSKIKIDNEEIEFENATISYVIDPHANKRSGDITVRSRVRTNTTSLSFLTVNKNSVFCNKLFQIAFHKLDANNVFNVEVEMTNGLKGNLKMIVSQGTISAAKAALTGDNVALVEYDEGVQNA